MSKIHDDHNYAKKPSSSGTSASTSADGPGGAQAKEGEPQAKPTNKMVINLEKGQAEVAKRTGEYQKQKQVQLIAQQSLHAGHLQPRSRPRPYVCALCPNRMATFLTLSELKHHECTKHWVFFGADNC